jgi:hypothetical protein
MYTPCHSYPQKQQFPNLHTSILPQKDGLSLYHSNNSFKFVGSIAPREDQYLNVVRGNRGVGELENEDHEPLEPQYQLPN